MKTSRPASQLMKHLSNEEQKGPLATVRYGGKSKPCQPSIATRFKRLTFLALCAGGILVADTSRARAVDPPQGISAPALFDQANADQRANHLGPAILGYERALSLAPHDQGILQNLRMAREKAGVAAPESPAHWLSFDQLALLGSGCLLMICLLYFGVRLIPPTLRSPARRGAVSLGAVVVGAVLALALRWPELDRAVIVGSHSAARIAPAANAAMSFELKPGETVHAESSYGEFVRVRSADGRSGWVMAADVQKIIPEPS